MGRLYSSDFDKFKYGERFVELINQFYDRVDAIQEDNKAELPQGIRLDDTFGFDLESKDEKGVVFNNSYDLPQHIMKEIFEEFKDVFKK